MTSIALLYTTATSSKANTTRVFEEEAWSGQLNLSVNVWSERLWFQHYPRIIPFSVKGVDGGDAWRPRTVNGSVFATQSVAFGLDFDSLAHEIKKRKHVTKSEYSLWPSHIFVVDKSLPVLSFASLPICNVLAHATWGTVPRCNSWHNGTTGVLATNQPKA